MVSVVKTVTESVFDQVTSGRMAAGAHAALYRGEGGRTVMEGGAGETQNKLQQRT